MCATIGADLAGEKYCAFLAKEGVDSVHVRVHSDSTTLTATSTILVEDDTGERLAVPYCECA